MVHLNLKDAVATVAVVAATTGYLLWLTDTALTGWSTRSVAIAVFALGFVGCTSVGDRMGSVYGAQGSDQAPLPYVVVSTVVGGVALVAGLVAMIAPSTTMLATLVVAMLALWIMATARHLLPGASHLVHSVGSTTHAR